MRKEAIGTGETVEEAREAACRELGIDPEEAQFEVLEMPVRKTLGIFGGNPAKVRVYVETSPGQQAADYLREILDRLGLPDAKVGIQPEEGGSMLTVSGDDVGFIIGHRGETLDALQYLCGLVANHSGGDYYRITLDIGNYREKRRETLESLGKKLAAKAVKIGRNCMLEPMNPYERRIIHTAVQTVPGAKSWSEGKDQARHVVIGPEGGERPQRRNNNNHYASGRKPGGPRGRGNQRGGKPYKGRGGRPGAGNRGGSPADGGQPAREKIADLPLYGKVDPTD